MGRRKIEITEVKDPNTKQVTFSKRRTGLFKKANELSILCKAEVAIVVFSPGNKPYSFGHPSVDVVAEKFLQYPKSNVAKSNDVQGNIPSDDIGNMDSLNLQLSQLQAQLREEQKKAGELDKRLKQQHSQNLECQHNAKDYFDAIQVSEYMLLLAKEPVVGKITKKR
ncbi:hypothetical protein VNO78_10161 [Psophocarpus tetragonolobus]|uniref:MADS-box domain-containing protein n=1 Tax=Psophocarpus tetragonolobus TaxID=3891 RepID=A0AAN9SK72_PSOTE